MNYTRSIKSIKRFCAEIQQISKSGVTTFARELEYLHLFEIRFIYYHVVINHFNPVKQ